MKFLNLVLFLFMACIVSSQTINQFDKNGKRHGHWAKTFENTKVLRYEGEFFHGKEIGEFRFFKNINNKAVLSATRLFNKENDITDVKFFTSKGKLISEGKMDGKTFVGAWKYYQKNSDNLLILENFNIYGQLDGERFVYYEKGKIAEKQNYKSGKLDGVSEWYSEKNTVLKEFLYVDGELHGPSKYYSPKGNLLAEGQYKRGKKDSVWKYYENGTLKEEKDFTYKPKYINKSN